MDPYTARGEARIRQRDIAATLRIAGVAAADHLAALEQQRGRQAEAEVARLLKQHGLTPPVGVALVARLRQTIGAALIRTGERLVGTPQSGAAPETTPAVGPLSMAG